MPTRTLLGVFARYWEPGMVKTRLARRIGDESAARLHRQFVAATLTRLSGIGDTQWLAITPEDAIARTNAECAGARSWRVVAQADGDLGQRMYNFFRDAFGVADRVVLIGSDSPDLPHGVVSEAFAALSRAPVVLGPAADGGYYLIGLAARLLAGRDPSFLFDAMPWSRDDLLTTTLRKLADRGIECHLLPPWRDVDDWDDLLELDRRLAKHGAGDALTDLHSAVEPVIAAHLPEQLDD